MDRAKLLGITMGVIAALIGGGWQVATRAATTATRMAPMDVALLRYGIPALVLAPVLWRVGLIPTGVRRRDLALMWIGAGVPFGLLAILGTRYAPAAHMGVFMAGASPLIAALLSWVIWRERPSRTRAAGLAAMTLGVALLGSTSLASWTDESWRGDLLFLAAAGLWALYALVFRRVGVGPWTAAALVNTWSAIVVLVYVGFVGQALTSHSLAPIAWQALWQGVLAGVLGLWSFSVAIARLGAAQAAAFGALAPAVSALGGWAILGDRLTAMNGVAVVAAMVGVALASGAFDRSMTHGNAHSSEPGDARSSRS